MDFEGICNIQFGTEGAHAMLFYNMDCIITPDIIAVD